MLTELKRRLRLLLRQLNFGDPSRRDPYNDQLHVGEGAISGPDHIEHHF
jgi:hypothetical protein